MSSFLQDPEDTPPPTKIETREERLERRRKEKAEQVAYKLEQEIALCKYFNVKTQLSQGDKFVYIYIVSKM